MTDDKWRRRDERMFKRHEWLVELKSKYPPEDVIASIEEQVLEAEFDYLDFVSILAGELFHARRDAEALALLDRMIPMFPDDVHLPIERAGRLHFFTEDQDEALRAAELAAERARRTNRRVSEALCLKARIFVRLKRGEELAQTLEEMIALEPLQGVPDFGFELDFLDRAPPGLIPQDLVDRYLMVVRERRRKPVSKKDA